MDVAVSLETASNCTAVITLPVKDAPSPNSPPFELVVREDGFEVGWMAQMAGSRARLPS
jgi:hypothetical protein